jgi:hypothetical protein
VSVFLRALAIACAIALAPTPVAFAQDLHVGAPRLGLALPSVLLAEPEDGDELPAAQATRGRRSAFSPLMLSLYVATAAIQGLDAHSTLRAIDAGAVETNPLVRPFVSHPPAFVAFKMGVAAGLIYVGHGLAKKSKPAAVVALIATNIAYGYLVHRNYEAARVARR